ncbi:glycoside hydrolase superfamily, partial [Desarmillaria ectypa]
YVRGRLAAYVNDFLSLGVDGLHLYAAKYIATNNIANIKNHFSLSPYITQEVIWRAGEPIQPSEYVQNGDIALYFLCRFHYTTTLKSTLTDGNISGLVFLSKSHIIFPNNDIGWISGLQANVFIANHDTERNGNSLNINLVNNTYVIVTIFLLAHPYGTPSILSSYLFSSTDDGTPNNDTGTCSGTGGVNGWYCQHHWVAFTSMVSFQNSVGSAPLTKWVSSQFSQITFG